MVKQPLVEMLGIILQNMNISRILLGTQLLEEDRKLIAVQDGLLMIMGLFIQVIISLNFIFWEIHAYKIDEAFDDGQFMIN